MLVVMNKSVVFCGFLYMYIVSKADYPRSKI